MIATYWPVALKIVYSGVLAAIVGVVLREFYLVWFDDRLIVGNFQISVDGDTSANPEDFSKKVVAAQRTLALRMQDYQNLDDPSGFTDETFVFGDVGRFEVPRSALEGVNIVVQEVNITAIATALRKKFSAPNEISGHITSSDGSVLAVVEWPRAPKGTTADAMDRFGVPAQTSLEGVAHYVGCAMIWAAAVTAEDSTVTQLPRQQFCDFATGLSLLYALRPKTPEEWSDEYKRRIRRHAKLLGRHSRTESIDRLPSLLRLQADLLDLLPDQTPDEARVSQEARLQFALRTQEVDDMTEQQKREHILALARPAIIMRDSGPEDVPPNWKDRIERYSTNIEAAAKATGRLDVSNRGNSSAFIVAPELALAPGYMLPSGTRAGPVPEGLRIRICFDGASDSCDDSAEVSEIVFVGAGPRDRDFALFGLRNHIQTDHPPLALVSADTPSADFVGEYAFAVGFALHPGRLPDQFAETLLGGKLGIRRVMPGRIMSFRSTQRDFMSDISTTLGTAGGPLVNMQSGEVLGMSSSGEWRGERGKFAFSPAIPKSVRDIIDLRLGKAEAATEAPGGNQAGGNEGVAPEQ